MEITANALIMYSERHAGELEGMAAVCRRVPAQSPTNMQEALQYYWFVHLGI